MVGICGYELTTNLQNFTQKDLTEMKIFLKVLGGYFFKHPVQSCMSHPSREHKCVKSTIVGPLRYSCGQNERNSV